MLLQMQTWDKIRDRFTEDEKAKLNGAICGETICPRGVTLDGRNHHSTDPKAIEKAMFTTDDDWLLVYVKGDDEKDPRPQYWVRFVYGNDGWDVISDYSVHLEPEVGECSEAGRIADHYEGVQR